MARKELIEMRGIVLDVQVTFSLREFCDACGVRSDLVVEMVEEGVIEPQGHSPDEWLFQGPMLVRAKRALRLVDDLGVNWPGAALALDLLEQLEESRHG